MKTQFVRNQKVIETCLNPGEEFALEETPMSVTAYFIDENETEVMLYIDEENLGLPEEISALNLTCDGIACKSEAEIEQEIPSEYNENIVLLEKREGKLFTYLGYEIELKAFEKYSPRTYDSEDLSYGVWNEEMFAFQFIDEWNGCKTLSFEEANQMASKLNNN